MALRLGSRVRLLPRSTRSFTHPFSFLSISSSNLPSQPRCFHSSSPWAMPIPLSSSSFSSSSPPVPAFCSRAFVSHSSSSPNSLTTKSNTHNKEKFVNTKVNFSLSDSDDNDDDDSVAPNDAGNSKLPPPYDPFNKKAAVEEPEDPKDLQAIFHKMRTEGLTNNAVKMFDALSKDGLTHEALRLFSHIKDTGHMPDVVAHTAVIEAYTGAGQSREALKVFLRMLACGVVPNAYTYSVLIKGLSLDVKMLGDAKKYLLEMMEKGMRPNAATYTAVVEALAREQKEDEARELVQKMEEKGFVIGDDDEKAVKEAMHVKRGQVFRTVMNVLFNK